MRAPPTADTRTHLLALGEELPRALGPEPGRARLLVLGARAVLATTPRPAAPARAPGLLPGAP